jgi:hypothetical protein
MTSQGAQIEPTREDLEAAETSEVLSKAQDEWKKEWYLDWIKYRNQERSNKVPQDMQAELYDPNADHSHFLMKVHHSRLESSLGDIDCSICYDDLRTNNPRQLPCGHMFHLDCLKQVFARRENGDKCPFCGREWTLFRVPDWNFPQYKYFNQYIPGERPRQIRVQVGGFKKFGLDLTDYEKRHWGEKLGTLKDCSDWVMGIISNEHEQIVPRFKEYVWKPKPAASKTSGQVASDESTEDTKVESGPSNSTPDASKTNPTSTGEVAVNESNSAFENVDELHSKINELNTPNYEDHSYRPPLSPIIEEENGEAQPLEANQSAEPDMDGRRSRRGHRVPSPSPSPSPSPEEKSKTD